MHEIEHDDIRNHGAARRDGAGVRLITRHTATTSPTGFRWPWQRWRRKSSSQ
jgi:hypothetical protein